MSDYKPGDRLKLTMDENVLIVDLLCGGGDSDLWSVVVPKIDHYFDVALNSWNVKKLNKWPDEPDVPDNKTVAVKFDGMHVIVNHPYDQNEKGARWFFVSTPEEWYTWEKLSERVSEGIWGTMTVKELW